MTEDPEERSTELLLEQYKLYVEMMDKVSDRRIDTTRLYTSLLTALLAVVSFVPDQGVPTGIRRLVFLMIGIMGIALCILWILHIESYKQLNSLKFTVIHEMEQGLPFPCYDREWGILEEKPEKHKYRRLWKVERYVPVLLVIPYVILLVYALVAAF